MESHGRPRRRIRRGEVVEPRRPAGHSQGRRLGVLWARVIDDLRDFNVLDRGCDAVKVGHLLTKLVGEELTRRLFRIPDVEVVRPSGGLVQCEELEAEAWHAFELRPSIVGNTDHSRAVERLLVLERDVDTNHGSSCGLSTHFYALAAGSPQVGRTDVEASLAGYCCLEHANA